MIARINNREVEIINTYGKKWKFKTNIQKLKILPIGTTTNQQVTIKGQVIGFSTEGKILGSNQHKRNTRLC